MSDDNFKLEGRQVRITWMALPYKATQNESTIFRGAVTHEDGKGIWIYGSFFVEKAETLSVREAPKHKDEIDRFYFAPWSSIDVVQIIEEGTKDHEIHKIVLSRRQNSGKDKTANL